MPKVNRLIRADRCRTPDRPPRRRLHQAADNRIEISPALEGPSLDRGVATNAQQQRDVRQFCDEDLDASPDQVLESIDVSAGDRAFFRGHREQCIQRAGQRELEQFGLPETW